jgi:hypothetical protein
MRAQGSQRAVNARVHVEQIETVSGTRPVQQMINGHDVAADISVPARLAASSSEGTASRSILDTAVRSSTIAHGFLIEVIVEVVSQTARCDLGHRSTDLHQRNRRPKAVSWIWRPSSLMMT